VQIKWSAPFFISKTMKKYIIKLYYQKKISPQWFRMIMEIYGYFVKQKEQKPRSKSWKTNTDEIRKRINNHSHFRRGILLKK